MRILLVAEGEHELNPDGENSALAEIVRRLSPFVSQIDRRLMKDPVVEQTPVHGKKRPHQRRLMMWIRWAEKAGYDAVIAVIDEDGYRERKKAVEELQESTFSSMRRALGLAIHMFDAWMLADEHALSAVLALPIERQKDPEKIKEPKAVIARYLEASQTQLSGRQVYLEVARRCNLDQMEERCPKGFAPFRRNVEQLTSKPD